eukprot:6809259-Prymnesium_polylepis.3
MSNVFAIMAISMFISSTTATNRKRIMKVVPETGTADSCRQSSWLSLRAGERRINGRGGGAWAADGRSALAPHSTGGSAEQKLPRCRPPAAHMQGGGWMQGSNGHPSRCTKRAPAEQDLEKRQRRRAEVALAAGAAALRPGPLECDRERSCEG